MPKAKFFSWRRLILFRTRIQALLSMFVHGRESFFGRRNAITLVGEAGIEPTTPGLEGRCSIQLSYSPARG
jgi:hypothetical protein